VNKRQFAKYIGLVAAGTALPSLTRAQGTARATLAELAAYEGPDRTQRLIAGAKAEGNVMSLYTSAPTDDMAALTAAFEKKYGIKTTVWRSGSEKVLQRAVVEARGNRHSVDIIETNGPEMESLHREQLLQVIKSPYLKDLIKPALRPHGEWVGTRLNVFVQAYNTNAVKKAELPKAWTDLLDPRWKGRLGIEAEDEDWLAGIVAELGEERGLKLFKDIVATNGISVRKGHTLLTQLVISGEIPFALTVYNYKAEQLKNKGAPIEWMAIGDAIARPNGVGVLKHAPNPHAALLFYDFEISEEGQKLLFTRDFVPTSTKVDTPLNRLPMKFVDARVVLDDYEKWTRTYQDIFAVKPR